MAATKQIPTVGRKVWLWPNENRHLGNVIDDSQPFDASVAYVDKYNPDKLNLSYTDHHGYSGSIQDVYLKGSHEPANDPYWEWMPYQQNQFLKQQAEVGAQFKSDTPQPNRA